MKLRHVSTEELSRQAILKVLSFICFLLFNNISWRYRSFYSKTLGSSTLAMQDDSILESTTNLLHIVKQPGSHTGSFVLDVSHTIKSLFWLECVLKRVFANNSVVLPIDHVIT